MSVLIFGLGGKMSEGKSNTVVEKLILFAIFLVFAGIVVAFAFKWNYVEEDTSSDAVTSFQYVTSSKTDSTSTGESTSDTSSVAVGKININTATAEELDSIPEIGPSKAKAIIEYRETEGEFSEIEDIMNVSGIGEKTFEKLKDYITVE